MNFNKPLKKFRKDTKRYSEEELIRLTKYFEILIRINNRIKLVKQPKCKTKRI
jgi:hypothetical protein